MPRGVTRNFDEILPGDNRRPGERMHSLPPSIQDLLDSVACILADGDCDAKIETNPSFYGTLVLQLAAWGFDPRDADDYEQDWDIDEVDKAVAIAMADLGLRDAIREAGGVTVTAIEIPDNERDRRV